MDALRGKQLTDIKVQINRKVPSQLHLMRTIMQLQAKYCNFAFQKNFFSLGLVTFAKMRFSGLVAMLQNLCRHESVELPPDTDT